MKHRLSLIPLACFFVTMIAATPAFAQDTAAVGTCMPDLISFDNLDDAVHGIPAGGTLLVCPGVYAEQIVITKSMTLQGVTFGNGAYPVIKPPPGGLVMNAKGLNVPGSFFGLGTPLAAQVLIQSGLNVTITDMALDATGFNIPTCNKVVVGVLIQDSSATLSRVAVKNQLESGPPPCDPAFNGGAGVLAQNDTVNATTVTVQDSTFVNAAQAFEADGASITTTLTNSSFAGNPASNANAISIVNGGSTIQGNTISNYNYPPETLNLNNTALGIYLQGVPSGTVDSNNVTATQVGIFPNNDGKTFNVSVTNNTVSGAQFVGIDVGGINGLVQGNAIRSSRTAIRFPGGSAGNTIQGNVINDVCTVFGSNPAAGVNTILDNTISNALNLKITNTTALCP